MRSQRTPLAAPGYVVVPIRLVDTAPTSTAIRAYLVISRMCIEVDGWCSATLKTLAKNTRVGIKSMRHALVWLEENDWIAVSRKDGIAYSYLAFAQQKIK